MSYLVHVAESLIYRGQRLTVYEMTMLFALVTLLITASLTLTGRVRKRT